MAKMGEVEAEWSDGGTRSVSLARPKAQNRSRLSSRAKSVISRHKSRPFWPDHRLRPASSRGRRFEARSDEICRVSPILAARGDLSSVNGDTERPCHGNPFARPKLDSPCKFRATKRASNYGPRRAGPLPREEAVGLRFEAESA